MTNFFPPGAAWGEISTPPFRTPIETPPPIQIQKGVSELA